MKVRWLDLGRLAYRRCRGTSPSIMHVLACQGRKNERRCRGTSPPVVRVGCAGVSEKLVAADEQPAMR